MHAAARPSIPLSPRLVATGGIAVAFLCGALIGRGPATGIGFLGLVLFLPLLLLNLPLAIALWLVVTFIEHLPVVSVGPTAMSVLVLLGFLGLAAGRRSLGAATASRALLPLAALMAGWASLSMLWAESPGDVWEKAWTWWVPVAIFAVVAGTVRTRRHVELLMAGFVGGAVLSVTIGLAADGLAGASSAYETATSTEGRLQGGSGDPNYLAAGIVAALALAGGLSQVWRDPFARLALLVGSMILVVGLVATQSRGGLVAAVVALVVAVVIHRGRRAPLLAGVALMLVVGSAWLSANPAAVARFTTTDQGGNGRSELWTIGWTMAKDEPLLGVGLNNYRERAPEYVREVGGLRFVEIIAERPHLVHNAYLQFLAELGVVGLAILLAIAATAVSIALRAARRMQAAADAAGTALARALVVALVAMLTASFFLSNGDDPRLWVLIGLAPAMLALSRRERAA